MPVAPDEVEHRVELMKDALRRRGMRLTHQRLEVVREIAGADEHPDVELLFRNVRARVPTISLDTVYRTMATLVDVGCVTRTTLTPGPARYDANVAHHHHFVCTRCGMARDIVDPALDAFQVSAKSVGLGTVETIEVRLRGLCANCESREDAERGVERA
ncbi:MAG TPA: Fur family transcriptional regulator [Coriobacteriia bacterium]|nr:Fur family transcriptional regulator [Coriobacteriia bacterium]